MPVTFSAATSVSSTTSRRICSTRRWFSASIALLYARTRRDPARQLDFVLFLDGVPSEHKARFADEETFCASIDRPRGFNE